MAYVNGFLAPVRKDQLDRYRTVSDIFTRAVTAHGALSSMESVGDGLDWGQRTSFPRAIDLKEGEVVVFSWVVWPSKDAADRGNAAVMENAELQAAMRGMEFDGKRMIWSGFEPLASGGAAA